MTIEKYIDGWKAAASLARSGQTWIPLVLLAVLKAVLVVLIYLFWHPWLSAFMTPALERVFREEAVHFPDHVLMLGTMFRRVDLVVTILLGFPLIGWSLRGMTRVLREKAQPEASAGVNAAALARGFLVTLGVFALASKGVPIVVSEASLSVASPKLQMLAFLVGLCVSLAATGLLLYGPVIVARGEPRAAAAIGRSIRLAREWDWLTGMVVVTGWVFLAPAAYVVSNTATFLASAGADLVFAALLVNVFLEEAALYFIFATAASLVAGGGRAASSGE